MEKVKSNTNTQPIRLFRSNLLEFFTHISPIIVLIIWLPVAGFFIYRSVSDDFDRIHVVLFGIFLGLFLWTLTEYLLHRFLFHFPAKNAWQTRISFLFHGIHHEQPRIKTRLVMPPVVSIPMALIFYGFFWILFSYLLSSAAWFSPVFAGFILGYIFYDMTHYATHHFRMKKGYFRRVRQHHMHHHFQTPEQRFGVSSPVWDNVFGTLPD